MLIAGRFPKQGHVTPVRSLPPPTEEQVRAQASSPDGRQHEQNGTTVAAPVRQPIGVGGHNDEADCPETIDKRDIAERNAE